MKGIIFVLILLILTVFLFGEKVATLSDIMKPASLVVDKDQFYIIEKTTVFIYSLKDYKFVKKFGKEGAGPQEFKVQGAGSVDVIPQPEHLQINSVNKVSFFTKDGKFKKEVKSTSILNIYWPIGDRFVGFGATQDKDNKIYYTFNIYDSSMKKVKEIHRIKYTGRRGDRLNAIGASRDPITFTHKNKIYLNRDDGKILVFNENGEKISEIGINYKKEKITDEVIKKYLDFFKTDPRTRNQYEAVKNRVFFPDYFPVIRDFTEDNPVHDV